MPGIYWPASTALGAGETWIVGFWPTRTPWWWNWLAVGPWKHCACLRFNAAVARWEVYTFGLDGVEVLHLGRYDLDHLLTQWLGEGAEFWAIEQGDRMPFAQNPVLNCVGMVKGLVRRGGGALRPTALYWQLRKAGASRAWGKADGNEGQDAAARPRAGEAAEGGRAALPDAACRDDSGVPSRADAAH